MAGIASYFVCLLFTGILHSTIARPDGAPQAVCTRPDLRPNHFNNGVEIMPQSSSSTGLDSPYVVHISQGLTDNQEYGPTNTLKVQIIRRPQSDQPSENFQGIVLQMRAGTPPQPVGIFELDPNQPENSNTELNHDFMQSYKILQCPRQDPNNPANTLYPDNSVTHQINSDKAVTSGTGPAFIWRPTTNDGIWNKDTGYGPIHAKATIARNRETFWVSLQTSHFEFRSPCTVPHPCGNNGACVTDLTPFGYTCDCDPGWFGDACQYNCALASPVCQNGGTCNTDINSALSGQLCTCNNFYSGIYCQTYTPCTPNPCGLNGNCAASGVGGYSCTCFNGWFGPNCGYNCNGANPCQNGGICNTDTTTQSTQPCICPANAAGQFCAAYITCPGDISVFETQAGALTTVRWNAPTMTGFATVDPFFFYSVNGQSLSTTVGGTQVQAQFNLGTTTVNIFGTDNILDVTCSFDVQVQETLCTNQPCQNGGTCNLLNGGSGGYYCDCTNTGYKGITCTVDDCYEPEPEPETCPTGQCLRCVSLDLCQKDSNGDFIGCDSGCEPDSCNGNGQCINGNGGPYTCLCFDGWTGNFCSTRSGCNASPCNENQLCQPNGQTDYTCVCADNRLGNSCQYRNPCSTNLGPGGLANTCNPGICSVIEPVVEYPASPAYANFICYCPDGLQGTFCETPVCNPNGCLNGGQCNFINGQSTCSCPPGYTGFDCSILEACQNLGCQNGGFCQPINGDPFAVICNCQNTGYTGALCDVPVCSPVCLNGGICIVTNGVGTCDCSGTSFTGSVCSVPVCSPICQNGAACVLVGGIPTCQCPTGYTGNDCGIPPTGCADGPCENGGVCTTVGVDGFQCTCYNGWFGSTCQYRDQCIYGNINCLNGGTCSSDPATGEFITCEPCNIGYSGLYCENGVCNNHQCINGLCVPTGAATYTCQCELNWTGVYCDTPIQTGCSPNPCLNGGVCSAVGSTDFTCTCPANYFGTRCETFNGCAVVTCENGGECSYDPVTGAFQGCINCAVGYSGLLCNIHICDNHYCSNGGVCVPISATLYRCQCPPNWQGDYCERPLQTGCTPNPCLNGGACTPVGTTGFTCTCPANYFGAQCETHVCDYHLCVNGGTCVPLNDYQYRCDCPPQWFGDYCEQPAACLSGPCQNEGTCTPTSDGYLCQCGPSWTGPTCTIPVACQPGAQNPCQNGGTCIGTGGSSYECQCTQAWTGQYCHIAIACLDPTICQNGGTCEHDSYGVFISCRCPPGYFGNYCEQDGCYSNPCGQYGTCQTTTDVPHGFYCICHSDYTGQYCEIGPVCGSDIQSDPCYPYGECQIDPSVIDLGYTCRCYEGYYGPLCRNQEPCSTHPCLNGGQCISYGDGSFTCQCYNEYSGQYCEIRPICYNNPCYNGGRCVPVSTSGLQYTCECNGPYVGIRCEILSGCHDNPCVNGRCIGDDSGGYECECFQGYTGRHCSIEPVCTYNPCYNGDCVPSASGLPTCSCYAGYFGTYCEIRNECYNYIHCYNGGTCKFDQDGQATCLCTPEYAGELCEIPNFRLCAQNHCLNGGTCWEKPILGRVCTCIEGFAGNECEHEIISCEVRYCDNGDCIDADFSRAKTSYCKCYPGWSGDTCSERDQFQNPCFPNPCQNYATCEVVNSYSYSQAFNCNCKKGYTGTTCEIIIPRGAASKTMIISLWTLLTALGIYLVLRRV